MSMGYSSLLLIIMDTLGTYAAAVVKAGFMLGFVTLIVLAMLIIIIPFVKVKKYD